MMMVVDGPALEVHGHLMVGRLDLCYVLCDSRAVKCMMKS